VNLADAQALFSPEPGWLNTASYGIPPQPAWDELQHALDTWRRGVGSWESWGNAAERGRRAFAGLIGADPDDVGIGSHVSQLVGLVAGSLPPGTCVLAPEIEFSSNLYPYLVHEEHGVTVETVPLAELVGRIDSDVDVVALSVVQSATGEVSDLAEVGAAARQAGALLAVDATQAVGWLPVDVADVDVLIGTAYKWLCSPRGTAFIYVVPELQDRITPLGASWYAGDDVHSSYYGREMRLAAGARRFDLSPAWQAWLGTAPAIELIADVGVEAIHAYDVALANRFREGLGLEPSNSAIVSTSVDDAERKLAAAGIRASSRAGSLRIACHLYTTDDDVDRALEALR